MLECAALNDQLQSPPFIGVSLWQESKRRPSRIVSCTWFCAAAGEITVDPKKAEEESSSSSSSDSSSSAEEEEDWLKKPLVFRELGWHKAG